jgi:hypothetical protein
MAAELLIGTKIMGNEMVLQANNVNNNVTGFTFNGSGATINNGNLTITRTQAGITNTIRLDPTRGIEVLRGTERQIYLDTNGNAVFSGTIQAANFIGGTISIGSGQQANNSALHIDNQGNLRIGGSQALPNSHILPTGEARFRNIVISGGSMTLGNTVVTEASFRTTNGQNSNFFNSDFDSTNRINGGAITLNSLNADRIQANTITGDKIMANTINGDRIIANTINGDRIIANTIHGDRIIANTILANRIGAGELPVNVIYSGTINTSQINAGTVNGVQMNWGAGGGLGRLAVGPGHASELAIFESSQGIQINANNGGMHLRATGQFWMEGLVNINIAANGMGGPAFHRNLQTLIRRLYEHPAINMTM